MAEAPPFRKNNNGSRKMNEDHRPVFKGIWIPAEIWEDRTLTIQQIALWAIISSLSREDQPCTASNAFLAERLQSTPGAVAVAISKMRKKGYIEDVVFDGRIRKMIAKIPAISKGRLYQALKGELPGAKVSVDQALKAETPPIIGENKDKKKERIDTCSASAASEIEAIYKAYPRKVGRPAAMKAIRRALKKTEPQTLLVRTQEYARHVIEAKIETQFIPHPATWFNQERFLDEDWGMGRAAAKANGKKPDYKNIGWKGTELIASDAANQEIDEPEFVKEAETK